MAFLLPCVPAFWKLEINELLAFELALRLATLALAAMTTRREYEVNDLVTRAVSVPRLTRQLAVVQVSQAHLHALPRAERFELDVFGIFRQQSDIVVRWADERYLRREAVVGAHALQHRKPVLGRLQRLVVTDEVHSALRA